LVFDNNKSLRNEFNLYFSRKFNNGSNHSLSLETDYILYSLNNNQNNEYNYYKENSLIQINNDRVESGASSYYINLKYSFPFENYKTKFGAKYFNTTINNTFGRKTLENDTWIGVDSVNNIFGYKESTIKSFISTSRQFNDNLGIKIALRFINSEIESIQKRNNEKKYSNYSFLMPSVFVNKIFNEVHDFTLNFNQSIKQPRF